jgi:hypothetical protein
LLEYLMLQAEQVVTRTMLLENIWEHHFDPQTNVIYVHISRLRQKIDAGFDRPLLHTVRLARGYAALFVASSLLLVGLLWWGTAGYLDRETRAVIRADVRAIQDDLPYRGLAGVIETIKDRVATAADGEAVYLLADSGFKPVAGNLQVWPAEVKAKPGWYKIWLLQWPVSDPVGRARRAGRRTSSARRTRYPGARRDSRPNR